MPEENKPTLTEEEVSDTPETDAMWSAGENIDIGTASEKCKQFARSLERRLSTARAQDRAALTELQASNELLRRDRDNLEKVGSEKIDFFRAENERLKTELEVTTKTLKNRVDTLAIADASVARLKAEVEKEKLKKRPWSDEYTKNVIESQVKEIDRVQAIVASSCPAGTDLASWVGQLAEDKRRLDWLESAKPHVGYGSEGCIQIGRYGDKIYAVEWTFRSAIDDASNPNPHDAFIHADQQDDAKSDASNPKTPE